MTTEDFIEDLISMGVKAYRKLNKNTVEGRKLSRHETVTIEGYEFTGWREYATFKTGEYIKSVLPESNIEVTLDGNNSTISVEMSNEEQQLLNNKMYIFLKKYI